MYAILDIETTGGKYNEEGITEIAVYKFDGHEIVDQFISLVNPERPIQPFVVNLTGINNDMLHNAPKFYEVAKRIVEITTDCIVVAHNATFDYRILKTEFNRLGYDFDRQSLCTVELAQQLIPDQKSYSLGKLVRGLGIPLSDRHRATGDAIATVKLFKLLLAKDTEKTIISSTIRSNTKKPMDRKLIDLIENIPAATGVYYIHNDQGKIIYIGKSKNLKKRLTQHFTNENRKAKKLQEEVENVTYEITGSELIALLKENEEIKKIKPRYNRLTKKPKFDQALYHFSDENGFINFKTGNASPKKKSITTFSNRQQAKSYMTQWAAEYNLCQKLMGLANGSASCAEFSTQKCNGACMSEEQPDIYNERAKALIEKHSLSNRNMIVLDRGRAIEEQSVILIENGRFKGIGYFNLNHQIQNIKILRSIVTPMSHNSDTKHIIQSYIRQNKRLKIVPINDE